MPGTAQPTGGTSKQERRPADPALQRVRRNRPERVRAVMPPMKRERLWILLVAALAIGAAPRPLSGMQPARPSRAQKAEPPRVVSTGRVTEIHGRRLFSMREAEGAQREVLVLAPRPLSTVTVGSTVQVEGTFRRLVAAELKGTLRWSDIDEPSRARFAGRRVLVAASLMASLESGVGPAPAPPEDERPTEAEPVEPDRPEAEAPPPLPLTISASMLGANFDHLAGQDVRMLKARVVGLLEPNVLLVEPATRYLKPIGTRDRIAVLIHHGALRIPAELLVGAAVTVTGTARTVLGMQVTAEVPWPAQLSPHDVKRLEVRGAVLATSVQTAEGTELTERRRPGW